jgi:UDP:flavonoid glycosyltransferase YjiC (YdhE family)
MSRILLAWELGLNLGHLTRLLPVAQRLKADGHTVLVATRDIQAAAVVLAPAGIPFAQAPFLPKGIALPHRPGSYADILLSQGWSDRQTLYGLTHAWLNLLRLFNPDRLILDYSPTVSLAARIAKVPTLLIGNGFELPPASDPPPPFPDFSWATPAKAAESAGLTVANANAVLRGFGAAPLTALCDLVLGQTRLLLTYPELDHYGERPEERYVGPLLPSLRGVRVDWPAGTGPKIFATLRPDTSHVSQILTALAGMDARVICVVDGFTSAQLEGFKRSHILFSSRPVDLTPLQDADLCITYGAEGTTLRFLLAGVPQLIAPWHVETYMAARRIEAFGCGLALTGSQTPQSVTERVSALCAGGEYRARARAFAECHRGDSCEETVREITSAIDVGCRHDGGGGVGRYGFPAGAQCAAAGR